MPRRNKRVTIRTTSVPELHQWLRACKRENARKKSQGHNGTKKQTKDLHNLKVVVNHGKSVD